MTHTVILVDDDANVLDGLRRAFRKEPYDIITATTGDEAWGILRTKPVDVVICDEQMPGFSGTQFLAETAKAHPHLIRMMLTGHANPILWQRAITEGAVYRFFCKPYSGVELALAIREALRQRGLHYPASVMTNT